MGTLVDIRVYSMKVTLVLCVLWGMGATAVIDGVADVETSVGEHPVLPHSGRIFGDINNIIGSLNFPVCCNFARSQCARDCAGISCSSSYLARCGFIRECPVVTCTEVAGDSCTS